MAIYRTDRIYKPPYFKLAPLTRGRSQRLPYVIGFDSEAEKGKPFLFQFAHMDKCPIHGTDVDLLNIGLEKHAGLYALLDYLAEHCTRKDVEYVVVGFNLQYEWTQFFHDMPDDIKNAGEFEITVKTDKAHAAKIRAMNDKRYMATVELGGTKRRVKLIDAMAYFVTSLDNAAKIIGAGAKLAKPKQFTRKAAQTAEFVAYAKQDAVLTQRLGDYIVDLHQKYDVPLCMSAPHFAARVFRRRYLRSEIPLPEPELEQIGLDSYHGGKNGFYLDQPALLKEVWHYDIRSAYPEAMRQLPDPEQATWSAADAYAPGTHSLWRATVTLGPCKYGALQCRAGHYERNGRIKCDKRCADPLHALPTKKRYTDPVYRICATGYEIDAAIAAGELTVLDASGYVMDGPTGGPLAEYVDDFYHMKRYAKDDTERAAAKLFLNSLYGKFFQKVPRGNVTGYDIDALEMVVTDPEQDYDYDAGGLYHPPLASLITGYVRAKIHTLEHRYQSIMTSTDGFFAYVPPDGPEIGSELGMLSAEIGTLRIWRERLYVFTPTEGKPTYALHGFRGKVEQLQRMPLVAGLRFEYAATAMITLKMSTRTYGKGKNKRKYQPGEFIELPFDVLLPVRPP